MAPTKSIWRGPNAQHFTLVHRSQQDPLLLDGESSNRVLKSTPKRNEGGREGIRRNQLESVLGSTAQEERKNVGEAANYGVYFDDTEYDYMQHLRSIGGKDNSRRGGKDEEREEDVIMLEAPKLKKDKGKAKQSGQDDDNVLEFKDSTISTNKLDLPADVLPSTQLMPRTFEQDKEVGIRPDMDPHLRQVLEALDDDAFLMRTAKGDPSTLPQSFSDAEEPISEEEIAIEDETEDIDDFFGEIVKGGELEANEAEPEWRQLPPGGEENIWLDPSVKAARELIQLKEEGKGLEDLSLESRVALFKKAAAEGSAGKNKANSKLAPSSVGSKSIFGEKGSSRRSRHAGAKARLAASFYAPSVDGGATAFSMSSSAMERNRGLTKLDEQFAQMERLYEEEEEEEEEEEGDEDEEDDDEKDIGGPEDVDAIFDDFLSKNEIIGNRMRERLGNEGTTSIEKVDMIRRELGDVRLIDRKTIEEAEAEGLGPEISVEELISKDLAQRVNARQEWDVETIQTTKTNIENHPRTIAASESVAPSRISRIIPSNSVLGSVNGSNAPGSIAGTDRMAKIKIDPRTGRAMVSGYINIGARQARRNKVDEEGKDDDSNDDDSPDEKDFSNVNGDDEDDQGSDTGSDDTTTEFNVKQTIKRDRNESKDEKKARKQAAKEEKQNRKSDKAQRKAIFKAALQQRGGGGVNNNAATLALR